MKLATILLILGAVLIGLGYLLYFVFGLVGRLTFFTLMVFGIVSLLCAAVLGKPEDGPSQPS